MVFLVNHHFYYAFLGHNFHKIEFFSAEKNTNTASFYYYLNIFNSFQTEDQIIIKNTQKHLNFMEFILPQILINSLSKQI